MSYKVQLLTVVCLAINGIYGMIKPKSKASKQKPPLGGFCLLVKKVIHILRMHSLHHHFLGPNRHVMFLMDHE
jgi:hypothetical protein